MSIFLFSQRSRNNNFSLTQEEKIWNVSNFCGGCNQFGLKMLRASMNHSWKWLNSHPENCFKHLAGFLGCQWNSPEKICWALVELAELHMKASFFEGRVIASKFREIQANIDIATIEILIDLCGRVWRNAIHFNEEKADVNKWKNIWNNIKKENNFETPIDEF